jgi:hypothetical protein
MGKKCEFGNERVKSIDVLVEQMQTPVHTNHVYVLGRVERKEQNSNARNNQLLKATSYQFMRLP